MMCGIMISIHAPVKGATLDDYFVDNINGAFQSTHP